MRTKYQCLTLLKEIGYNPKLLIDVGVATGTDGLYEVWPDIKTVLIEGLPKFADAVEKLAGSMIDGEFVAAFAASGSGSIEIATNPDHVHAFMASSEAPAVWSRASIPLVTVDTVASRFVSFNHETMLVLKIDVDGHELDVLSGCEDLFQTDCVIIIEAALADEAVSRFGRIVYFLTTRGFEVLDIIEPLYRNSDQFLWQVDLVFVKRDSTFRSNKNF